MLELCSRRGVRCSLLSRHLSCVGCLVGLVHFVVLIKQPNIDSYTVLANNKKATLVVRFFTNKAEFHLPLPTSASSTISLAGIVGRLWFVSDLFTHASSSRILAWSAMPSTVPVRAFGKQAVNQTCLVPEMTSAHLLVLIVDRPRSARCVLILCRWTLKSLIAYMVGIGTNAAGPPSWRPCPLVNPAILACQ